MAKIQEEVTHMERNAALRRQIQSRPKGDGYNMELMLEVMIDMSTSLAEIADFVRVQKRSQN